MGGPVRIRDLTEYADFQRCAALQKSIWGPGFAELVPPAILMVASRTGGVIAGAFDDSGELVGFVFGITGFVAGAPLHWSDMLGVRTDMRGRGIGQALKLHQRRTLLDRGVTRVRWTFDPLEARNAFINLTRLGGTAREYIRNCYGDSDSPLHAGLATDRLLVEWQLDGAVRGRMEATAVADVPVINPDPDGALVETAAERVRIQIPADIQGIRRSDIERARRWRASTRQAFERCFGRGYVATELTAPAAGWSSYILWRD